MLKLLRRARGVAGFVGAGLLALAVGAQDLSGRVPAPEPDPAMASPADQAASATSATSAASAASAPVAAPAASGATSAASPANPSPPATRAATRRAPLVWRLEIDAPDPLDDLLRSYLDISRYQARVADAARKDQDGKVGNARDEDGEADAESGPRSANLPSVAASGPQAPAATVTRGELRRLLSAAPEQARSLLEAEGYFASDIKVSVSDEIAGQPVVVRIEVDPGPKAKVSQVRLVFEGELDVLAEQGDRDALALKRQLETQWPLPVGKPFLQAAWSSAKNATLATLRAEGYAAAVWSGTSATVDAQAQTARLFVVADSGPRFFYGPMTIDGLKRQPESAVRNTAGFKVGDPYRESQLLDFQERLQKLNLFESVFVSMSDDPEEAKQAPVTVKVRELPLQQATFGVGVSSDTGPRVSVEHLHRLLFGLPWQAKSKVQLGRDESVAQTDLTSHPNPGRKRWLLSLQASRQLDTDDARTLSYRVRAGQTDEGERLERTTYAEYVRAKVSSSEGVDVSDASALSANQMLVWRNVDSQILPTKGFTANVQGAVGHTFSTMEEAGWFARAYGRLTWYRPLPSHWYASVRAEGGQVFAADEVSVPDTLLFRAGGDESVRGYGYRTLGVQKEGVTVGGRTLVTSSVELAHPISQRFPSLWGAVFVDAGDAAERWSEMALKLGYGVGVRWRSPVGPLRLDLAYGQDVREYRVHFSVGITL